METTNTMCEDQTNGAILEEHSRSTIGRTYHYLDAKQISNGTTSGDFWQTRFWPAMILLIVMLVLIVFDALARLTALGMLTVER